MDTDQGKSNIVTAPRRFSLSASKSFSASDGEKVAQPDEVCVWGRGAVSKTS
jgi:hypothetical protein